MAQEIFTAQNRKSRANWELMWNKLPVIWETSYKLCSAITLTVDNYHKINFKAVSTTLWPHSYRQLQRRVRETLNQYFNQIRSQNFKGTCYFQKIKVPFTRIRKFK